jgi:hypothetical protein
MQSNPLGLPIPKLEANKVIANIRVKPAIGEFSRKYNDTIVSAQLRVSAKLNGKVKQKSPFTLDKMDDFLFLFGNRE